jgi:hypothetical protein
MIINLILCLIVAFPIIFFVLSPLISINSRKILSRSFEGFSDEGELRKVTMLRDAIFQKLVYGNSSNENVEKLTEDEALGGLVTLCGRLQQAGLPWLPSQINKPLPPRNLEEGTSIVGCLLLAIFSFLCIFSLFHSQLIEAQEEPGSNIKNEKVTAPPDVTIPPPTILPSTGYWLPSVNQFILIPIQGRLHVYYVGMFNNTFHAKGAMVQIPLPKGFADVQIFGNPNLIIEKSTEGGSPIINTPLSEGVNQLSVEFSIPAFYGVAEWKAGDLFVLPGVTIIMMPEYNSGLRNLFSKFGDSINIWPPRISNVPLGFRSFVGADPFDNNISSQMDAKQLSRQLVRVGDSSAAFPSFEINGVLPSRASIYVLVVFFAFFLFGVTLFFIFKTSK